MEKYNKLPVMVMILIMVFCLIMLMSAVSAADAGNSSKINVTANVTGGTYKNPINVSLTSNDSAATIYYTTNATIPDITSTRYNKPIDINTTTTLRYAALGADGNWSQIYLQNYVIGAGGLFVSGNYTGPQTNTTYWKYAVDGDSSAVVGSDGTVYVGSSNEAAKDGYLYAFKPDGTLKWKFHSGGGSAIIGSDGTIYIGGDSGIFYALVDNGNNCTVKWSYNAGFEHYIRGYNIGADETVYVGIANANQLIAFNPNGTVKWTYSLDWPTAPTIGSDGTLYLGSLANQNLFALNPDGTLKWTYTLKTTHGQVDNSPVIGSDGTLYFSDSDTAFYALNPDGTLKWTLNICGVPSISANGTIYVDSLGFGTHTIYALAPNGSVIWTYVANGTGYGSVIFGSDGTLYFGSMSMSQVGGMDSPGSYDIYALNSNGSLKWTYHSGGTLGGLTIGPNGTLYFGGRATSTFYAIKDPAPVADFAVNSTNVSTSQKVQFTDKSVNNVTSWAWDFNNDGLIDSTLQNPTYTYTTPGKYTVKLTVTGNGGNDTEVKTSYITVNVPDTTAPTVKSNIIGGTYNAAKTITLTTTDDNSATTYYTLDGSNPKTSSTRHIYLSSIVINSTTKLQYAAVDVAGNWSPVYAQTYTIDKIAPKVSSTNPKNGATGVSRTSTITIKFSENIKTSINWSKVVVKNQYGKMVFISKWISGNTLYIKTNSKRSSYLYYTVYIPASAIKDIAGNNLAKGYTFRFKTGKY